MWEVIVAVIGLLGSATGAIWAAYVGTRRRVLTELEARYDAELRASRLTVYPALWASLEPLAKYARESPGRPTRRVIESLAATLRHWYFTEGGIYLSVDARAAYFRLQDALEAVLASERWMSQNRPDDAIDPETFTALRKIGSWLRTSLTYDVGTRRPFSLAPALHERDDEASRTLREEDLRAEQEAKDSLTSLRSHWATA